MALPRLFIAAISGDEQKVTDCLTNGENIDQKDGTIILIYYLINIFICNFSP